MTKENRHSYCVSHHQLFISEITVAHFLADEEKTGSFHKSTLLLGNKVFLFFKFYAKLSTLTIWAILFPLLKC